MNIADVAIMILLALSAHTAMCLAFHEVSAGLLAAALVLLLYIAYWLHGVDHSLRRIVELLSGEKDVRPGLKAVIAQLQATIRDIAAEQNQE